MTAEQVPAQTGAAPCCPECGGPLPNDPRYVSWCPRCEWNLDPTPPPQPSRAWARRRTAAADRACRAAFDRARQDGPRVEPGLRLLTILVALPVHLVTLALLAAAAALTFSSIPPVLRTIEVLVLLGVLSQLRPRLGRTPRGRLVLTPDRAPAAFALIEQVAGALGTRPAELLVLDARMNASFGRSGLRRRRVLRVGLPLWNILADEEKLALLGHELAHQVNHDVRRGLWLGSAVDALRGWAGLLHPGNVRYRPFARRGFGSLVVVAEILVQVLLIPVHALIKAIGMGALRLGRRAGQTAEYRADLAAARVAGPAAMIALLTKLLLAEQAERALRFASARRRGDVWQAQRQSVADTPAPELDRLERISRRRLQPVDASHPPTCFRLDLIRALPATAPDAAALTPDPELLAAADRELRSLAPDVAELLPA